MAADSLPEVCHRCPSRVICRCLQVTEDMLLQALGSDAASTLKDLRQRTGAGDGCTACHRILRQYLARRTELAVVHASSSASPI